MSATPPPPPLRVSPPLAIAAVLLFSERPERLARFYREQMAVPLRPIRVPGLAAHWAADIGHVYLSIWPTRDGETGEAPPNAANGGAGVAFQVRDVVADFRRLTAAGVPVVFPPRRTAVGILARLRDPDGNALELVQPYARR